MSELERFYSLVDEIEVAMMTTRRKDGHLESRAMATQRQAAGADLWFVSRDDTTKIRDLQADPHINLAYYKARTKEWVSVSGTARISRDRSKIRELYEPTWKVWFPDQGGDRTGGPDDPRILLGTRAGEDAAVHRVRPELFGADPAQLVEVQTVDYFKAFVDDPYLFGRIAALNSVSDLYAMNARPFSALAIATLPYARGPIQEAQLYELLTGAVESLKDLGVVLTGMGTDGCAGSERIQQLGGQVIAQDQATSVVWGMPGAVARAGLADVVLPLPEMAAEILHRAGR